MGLYYQHVLHESNKDMNEKELYKIWREEEDKPFSGWDFSYLVGKMDIEPLPWSYESRARELMKGCSSLLDMGTGGGEFLLEMKASWPKKVTVTEDYPPNIKLATERLGPLGVQVVDVTLSINQLMPFKDYEFDLILNCHSGLNPWEAGRILAPGGVFFTQQVHGLSTYDLTTFFNKIPPYSEATPEFYIPRLKASGLTIRDFKEWSGKLTFTGVGALVYFLKAIPWVVPEFSVASHFPYLLMLQRQVEDGKPLSFTAKRYLIEATKQSA
jgi:SAM-dependent methyltransferase